MIKKIAILMAILMTMTLFSGYTYDDQPSSWAEAEVQELKDMGDFEGSRFKNYQEPVTRSEFMYFASRLFEVLWGRDIVPDPKISFTDTNDIWILKGATVGVSSGVGNGKFDPDSILTREQFATLLIRILKSGNLSLSETDKYTFTDDDLISPWAIEAVYLAKANGIIGGVGDNRLDPQSPATVEQGILLVNRIINKYLGETFSYDEMKGTEEDEMQVTPEVSEISMFADENVKIYLNEEEYDANLIERSGVTFIDVSEALEHFEIDESGNALYSVFKVNDTQYKFYRGRNYYYENKTRIQFSSKKFFEESLSSGTRIYSDGNALYVPLTVFLTALETDVNTSIVKDGNLINITVVKPVVSEKFTWEDIIASDYTQLELREVYPRYSGDPDIEVLVEGDYKQYYKKNDIIYYYEGNVGPFITYRENSTLKTTEDDVTKAGGLVAFKEKYNLGGYIEWNKIPTVTDIEANGGWNMETLMTYFENPPMIMSLDKKTAPTNFTEWDEGRQAFYEFLSEDKYLGLSYNGESGSTFNSGASNFVYFDPEDSTSIRCEIDAQIEIKSFDPVQASYMATLFKHYYGDDWRIAYDIILDYVKTGEIKVRHGYDIGSSGKQLIITEPNSNFYGFETIYITDVGYKWAEYIQANFNETFSKKYSLQPWNPNFPNPNN